MSTGLYTIRITLGDGRRIMYYSRAGVTWTPFVNRASPLQLVEVIGVCEKYLRGNGITELTVSELNQEAALAALSLTEEIWG